jgi:hypothetical protein
MTPKDENEIFFAVKGHLIPSHWSRKDIDRTVDSYIKRLWGNCERLPRTSERFEQVWKEQTNG